MRPNPPSICQAMNGLSDYVVVTSTGKRKYLRFHSSDSTEKVVTPPHLARPLLVNGELRSSPAAPCSSQTVLCLACTDATMSACGATAGTADPVEWDPSVLLRSAGKQRDQTPRFALVVLNQPLHNHMGVLHQLWNNGLRRPLHKTHSRRLTMYARKHRFASPPMAGPTASTRWVDSRATGPL